MYSCLYVNQTSIKWSTIKTKCFFSLYGYNEQLHRPTSEESVCLVMDNRKVLKIAQTTSKIFKHVRLHAHIVDKRDGEQDGKAGTSV